MKFIAIQGTLTPPDDFLQLAGLLHAPTEILEWMQNKYGDSVETIAQSIAEDIAGEREIVLIGHSTGAVAAALASQLCGPSIIGLVLINSGPHMKRHKTVGAMLEKLREMDADSPLWLEFARANVLGHEDAREAPWVERMVQYSRRTGGKLAASVLFSQWQINLADRMRSDCPVLVLHGKQDAKRTVEDAKEWSEVFSRCELRLIPDAGHSPHLEQPGIVAQAITAFSRSLLNAGSESSP